jgi:Spy/CpxP family protein refolding chaperone
MKHFIVACLVAASACSFAAPVAAAESPYVGQESRAIKALSPEDVEAYLSGKGMGLAKAAELNGYAGPAHVLELASQLSLTPEQRARTEALFASMQGKATELGRALVEQERELDRLFASKTITPERLASALTEIGLLQARVRGAHLEAHLAQVAILTPEQNARYAELRGYSGAGPQPRHDGQHRH